MKKIIAIFTSDFHFRDTKPRCRIDDYFKAQADKLHQISLLQKENDCPIFDCGDLLDNHKSSPYLEGELIDNLPNNFYTIAGNHDQPNHRIEDINKGSFGVLVKAGAIKMLANFQGDLIQDGLVCGFPFAYNFDNFNLGESKYKINIALVHEFVSLNPLPGSITPKELVEKLPGFDYIFCGHNHTSFADHIRKTVVINIGSVMRMDADQIDHKPSFWIMYEDYTVSQRFFKIKENVIDRKYIDEKKDKTEKIEAFVKSLDNKYEISNSFRNNIDNHLKSNKVPDGVKNKILEVLK